MGYLITQILIYLVLAAIIGFLVAWVIRGMRLGTRIEELENDLWRARQDPAPGSDERGDSVEELRAALAAARADCEKCRRELAQAKAAAGAGGDAPATRARRRAPAATGGGEAPRTLAGPSASPDDLKRIKGIGPKIESTLHSLGIYHFHQIAAWTPANVAWVNDKIRFKGRIEREKWIEQAKELST